MIILTGDVHSKIKGNWEQKKAGLDIDNAIKYLKILRGYRIPCTLFINGILLDKEPEKIKKLLKFDTEIGGHTYNNFGNINIFKSYLNRKLFGCVYGSKRFQKRDIFKTKKSFEKFDLKMRCWRTHAFASNDKTFKILKSAGVTHVSDLLGERKPFEKEGLIHIPLNIPVDQNTIAYGELKPENRAPFASCTKGRIQPDEWFEILKKRIIYNEGNKIDSIILIHPTTMAVIDNFKLFKEIAKFLSKYKSGKLSDIKI